MYHGNLGSPLLTFAQYVTRQTRGPGGHWFSTLSQTQRQAQYRLYVQDWQGGQYGGPGGNTLYYPGGSTIMRMTPPPGTGPGSSPSTMSPQDQSAPPQSPVASTPSLGPLVLFGGIGVIAFLYFRGKKASG